MIKVLPPSVADRIAAGEVVERPASVIKELVENSLDAGASHIEIRIQDGGKTLLEVSDNGVGMSQEDAKKCILRHATSKITAIDDIFSIQTFGFRGEALAAIAAVSQFTLITKRAEDDQATQIQLQGGEHLTVSSVPANTGTRVRAQDLFCSTPARRNYLKTDETEYRAIIKEIMNFALAHPNVSFQVFKDEHKRFDFPSTKQSQRIEQVLKTLSENLLEVEGAYTNLSLQGFVSAPGTCPRNKNHQYIFVNGRRIEDFRVSYAVREAYAQGVGIEKHLHPAFVLFLQTDPLLVDVNVHPRKLEVKFAEPYEVYNSVKSIITQTLNNTSSLASVPSFRTPHTPSHTPHSTLQIPLDVAPKPTVTSFSQQAAQRDVSVPLPSVSSARKPTSLRLIGQVSEKYIAAQSEEGLYLFDQHALHERQRFEQFWKSYQQKKIRTQKLLIPQTFSFPEESISLLHEHQKDLVSLGFGITFPQDDTLEVIEVPSIFTDGDLSQVLQDLMNYFQEEQIGEHSVDQLMRKLIEYQSCRGAVKFGDKLKTEEMEKLLADFASSRQPELCPHGRPHHIFTPFAELDKQFHR